MAKQKRASTQQSRTHESGQSRKRSSGTRKSNGRSHTHHMIENLEEGFLAEVADMMHAERQLVSALPKMAEAAGNRRLRDAIEQHLEETEEHVRRLENVFRLLSHKPEAEVCEGMKGILEESREQMQKTPQGPVRDAMIIASGQKVEHYEIASYGTLCAWAEELGEFEIVRILEQTLSEEKNADRTLSRIAESTSNREAEWRQERGNRGRNLDREFQREWGDSTDWQQRTQSTQGGRSDQPMASWRDREMEQEFRERGRFRTSRDRRYED